MRNWVCQVHLTLSSKVEETQTNIFVSWKLHFYDLKCVLKYFDPPVDIYQPRIYAAMQFIRMKAEWDNFHKELRLAWDLSCCHDPGLDHFNRISFNKCKSLCQMIMKMRMINKLMKMKSGIASSPMNNLGFVALLYHRKQAAATAKRANLYSLYSCLLPQ